MRPVYLLPEQVANEDGQSTPLALDGLERTQIALTLGITRILEDENLEVTIAGSPDGFKWHNLAAFPHKSYCGTYSMLLDLASHQHRSIRFLKAHWKMSRWVKGARPVHFGQPSYAAQSAMFGFYLCFEPAKVMSAAG